MRHIIKTSNESGIPSHYEISDFETKKGVHVNEVPRLYVSFKVGKRRKIKRLRITLKIHPCEYCGQHVYVSGKIGKKEFEKEIM